MSDRKRIGDYILEEGICTDDVLTQALAAQAALRDQNINRSLGSILIEDFKINKEKLVRCFNRMHLDILQRSTTFGSFREELLVQIVEKVSQQVVSEHSLIFEKGSESDFFFVIISGEVKIFIETEEGEEHELYVLKAGDSFGEIALLSEGLHSTSAKAVTDTSLLMLSKTDFESLCREFPDISKEYLKILARRVARGNEDLIRAAVHEKAYQQYMSQEDELSIADVIGETRAISNLRKKIAEVASIESPVLIVGEKGTEKLAVAAEIHRSSQRSSKAFMFMDAEDVSIIGSDSISTDPFLLETSQNSTLFGHLRNAFPHAESNRLGLLQICRDGTIVIENIDHLSLKLQEALLNFIKTGFFQQLGAQDMIPSASRIIGTATSDLKELVNRELFNQEFYDLLTGNTLTIPPLKKRKKDLRLLVDFIIIQECFKSPDRKLIKGISDEAYQRIMRYDWPGNMEELEVVIRRAIILAQGDYLMPEDVFVGMAPPEGKHVFNLLKLDNVRDLFLNNFYPAGLQLVTGAIFALIFFFAFTGSNSSASNIIVVMVWAFWWPVLVISWLLGARIWCAVCPMGAANDLLNRLCSLKRQVPKSVRKYGIYISAAGLALIVYVEASTNMVNSPRATGFLLLSILLCAILSGLLFERRLWCRYLCPLGRLGAVFSSCSVVEWRSNSSICNSTCQTNACFKGNETIPGCPVYQGPFSLRSNHNCILCGNCVKLCENSSPVLNVRIPGHELWAALKAERVSTIFMPVIMGTQFLRGLEYSYLTRTLEDKTHSTWAAYGIILLVATALSYYFVKIGGQLAFSKLRDDSIDKGALFTNALIPLAFAFELGYQVRPFLERLGHFFPILGRQFGLDLYFLDFAIAAGSSKPWQIFIVCFGLLAALIFLKIIIRNHEIPDEEKTRPLYVRRFPVYFLAGLYIAMFIVG
ncbi:MAG: sigma 54-interacting transcriptional regulator [Desulfofustis sp.]